MENKRVFVSPGVYTSERDLTFVTNNIGVTTLGLVGETQKGPAFQPIFISNYGEMTNFFGGLNPKKFKGTGMPQYELPYIAKAYLSNANQMYVTRVLGLSGYDAGVAYAIKADGKTIAVLRSRGKYEADALTFGVDFSLAPDFGVTITNASDLAGDFTITVLGMDASSNEYTVSMDKTKSNYITKVLGRTLTDSKKLLYVEDIYENYIDTTMTETPEALITVEGFGTEFANYKTEYKYAETPYIVSQIRAGETTPLFRFRTISDGNTANEDVKVSITNIKLDEKEFDVVVRKMNDTDANPVIIERYSKCNLDPSSNKFIGRRIGDVEGDYPAISSYILIDFHPGFENQEDSFPAGFEGYKVRTGANPEVMYATAYGEFENKRRKYLGFSNDFDADILKYKGEDNISYTKGFHLDTEANATLFAVGAFSFKNETELTGTTYESPSARKFTVLPAGGFDGWDIYRESRTNTDKYSVAKAPIGFSEIAIADVDGAIDSDFYAYLKAYRTFANPEEVDVNVFATPGIDLFTNAILSDAVIDIIERERGDSIYIATTPDMSEGSVRTPQDIASQLAEDFDSNYTATYYPWIQVSDTENNSNIYLPPTCEVIKNIAITDKVAHPWYATAGYKFGKVNAKKARVKLTQVHNEILYANRINPLITYAGEGIIIMGNKNLQVADTDLNRLNVRRLLLRARKLISAVGKRLLFEPNDETVRDEFLREVNPILENMRKERGLNNFKVEIDSLSPEGRDRNTLVGRILIQPTNALEYISISFDVTQNGATFDNV